MIYRKKIKIELLEDIPLITSEPSNTAPSQFSEIAIKHKPIKFECNINGTDYYLVSYPIDDCEADKIDCGKSTFILMEKMDVKTQLSRYVEDLNKEKEKCLIDKCGNNLDCQIKAMSTCEYDKFFINDFVVKQTESKIGTDPVYIIEGTYSPRKGNIATPTRMNCYLYDTKRINNMCGDISVLLPEKANIFQILVKETKFKPLKVKLMIKYDDKLMYLGRSIKKIKCKGKEYNRLSLYNNENDGNVLEFEPKYYF